MHCELCPIGPGCRGATHRPLCAKITSDPVVADHFRVRAGLLPAQDSPVVRVDQPLPETQGDRLVVVSRYNEDVRWCNDSPVPCLVYNKGAGIDYLQSHVGLVHLPNRGREAGTYLHHLVAAYDHLPEWTVFVQGTPHNTSVAEFFGRITSRYMDSTSLTAEYSPTIPDDSIKALDKQEWHGGYSVRYGLANPLEPCYCPAARVSCAKLWQHFFTSDQPNPWWFGYGAQWIVPASRIRARPRAYWQWCLEEVSKTSSAMPGDLASAWSFEMVWRYLFGDSDRYKVRLPEDRPKPLPVPVQLPSTGCRSCGGAPQTPKEAARRQWIRDKLSR